VVIFRTINGQRMVARFDVKDIRGGVSPDPIIMDGDLVVVGNSKIKTLWQDFLKTAPLFNAFAVMAR
jgi:polysaccharide export outer membrane protein